MLNLKIIILFTFFLLWIHLLSHLSPSQLFDSLSSLFSLWHPILSLLVYLVFPFFDWLSLSLPFLWVTPFLSSFSLYLIPLTSLSLSLSLSDRAMVAAWVLWRRRCGLWVLVDHVMVGFGLWCGGLWLWVGLVWWWVVIVGLNLLGPYCVWWCR